MISDRITREMELETSDLANSECNFWIRLFKEKSPYRVNGIKYKITNLNIDHLPLTVQIKVVMEQYDPPMSGL